jgi:hypothetical protein
MMHIVAILHDRSDAPELEDSLCVTPYRGLLTLRMISSTGCNVNLMAIRSPASRCSIWWPVGKPKPARTWRICWGCTAIPSAALLAIYVPAGKPLSLAPAVLASLEQALRRPEGFASYAALRQWVRQTHGVEVKYKTLYSLVRTRCRAMPDKRGHMGGSPCVMGQRAAHMSIRGDGCRLLSRAPISVLCQVEALSEIPERRQGAAEDRMITEGHHLGKRLDLYKRFPT